MRITVLLAIALASGCTDYKLSRADNPNQGVDTDTATDGDPFDSGVPNTEDCPDKTYPGYKTSSDADCQNEVATGTFDPVVEWYQGSFPDYPSANQIMSQPIVTSVNDDNGDGQIDDDDIPDIVVVTFDQANYYTGGVLRALSGDGSGELWANAAGGIEGTGGAAAGDIDGDGKVEIVSLTPTGATAFENDGTIKWTMNGLSGHITGTSDVPAISDMDHDGKPEIIAGNAILNNDGSIRGLGNKGMGGVAGNNVGSCSFAVDLDADGHEEVITGNAAYKANGDVKWSNGLQDGYPAVADLDGDGQGEVVVSGQGQLRILDTDGTETCAVAIPGADSSYYGGPPTIADFDGDGKPDIGVAAGSRYSVISRNCKIKWQAVTDDSSSGNTGSAVFDFEGDGVAEVVYADQTTVWVFNGVDGSVKMASHEHSNGTWLEYPSIADVDGDGHAEIVVPNTTQYGSYAGFHVFGDKNNSWRPGRKTWNQHAYYITNVNDDGSIPKTADLNWNAGFNSFRSGDMTAGAGLSAPDLTLAEADVCEIDCDEGKVRAWVNVGNEGAEDVKPSANVVVELYAVVGGGKEIYVSSQTVSVDVPSGQYVDSLQFDVTGMDPTKFEGLRFKVHSDELECDDSNNEITIEGPFCE